MILTLFCLVALSAPLAAQEEFAAGLGYINAPLSTATTTLKFNPFNLATLRWYPATRSVPNFTLAGGTGPIGAACDGYNVFTTNSTTNNMTKFMPDGTSVVIGTGPTPAAIAYDGQYLWITHFVAAGFVAKYRTTGGLVMAPIPAVWPAGIAYDGERIWYSQSTANTVTRVDGDGTDPAIFNVGTNPTAVCFDGTQIWVANFGSNNVTRIRASDGVVRGTHNVGTNPIALAYDGASIWVANQGSNNVTKLKASNGSRQGTYAVGSMPSGVAFDGTSIWVTNYGANTVTQLTQKGKVTGTYTTGTQPWGIAFNGSKMWIVNYGSNSVSIR
jgi:hypothetical protein